jgi:hypothetical protein
MHAWWPTLTATRVLARLADPAVVAKVAQELSPAQREALVRSYAWLAADDDEPEIVRGWSVADIALLDELIDMLGVAPEDPEPEVDVFLEGGDVPEVLSTADLLRHERVVDPDDDPQTTYAHILVDEGQDVTPMQWRMLRRRGPQSSWTIVGDPAQSSYPHQDETSRAEPHVHAQHQLPLPQRGLRAGVEGDHEGLPGRGPAEGGALDRRGTAAGAHPAGRAA